MLRSSARAFIPLATCFGAWSHQQTIECDSAIEEAIGNTKLVYLRSVSEATGCEIYGKAEWLNPTGSVKDRAAKQIVMEAERSGLLKPGGTICEGTGVTRELRWLRLALPKGTGLSSACRTSSQREAELCVDLSELKCIFNLVFLSPTKELREEGSILENFAECDPHRPV